jgi:hypothetical protein
VLINLKPEFFCINYLQIDRKIYKRVFHKLCSLPRNCVGTDSLQKLRIVRMESVKKKLCKSAMATNTILSFS